MPTVRYTVVDGEMIAEERGGVRRQYVPDPLGSTVALLDNSQSKTDIFAYWPYGEEQSRTGTTNTPFRFVGTLGYYRDSTALTFVRVRHLNTSLGRWMEKDPIQSGGNWYRYCRNNCINHTDIWGLQEDPWNIWYADPWEAYFAVLPHAIQKASEVTGEVEFGVIVDPDGLSLSPPGRPYQPTQPVEMPFKNGGYDSAYPGNRINAHLHRGGELSPSLGDLASWKKYYDPPLYHNGKPPVEVIFDLSGDSYAYPILSGGRLGRGFRPQKPKPRKPRKPVTPPPGGLFLTSPLPPSAFPPPVLGPDGRPILPIL